MSETILRMEGLTVGYGETAIVRDILAEVRRGEISCLIGPNGTGKTTVLRTLIRELLPLAGTVLLDGKTLTSMKERDMARQSAALLTGRQETERIRCAELVAIGRYPYTGRLGILGDADRQIVRESMDLVGVTELADSEFSQISDGQRQRVLLARAICQEPKLLILDEPTSFLDIRHKLEFLGLLRRLAKTRQIGVILSMHELDLAQKFSDRVICIGNGRITAAGTPEEIFVGDTIRRLYGVDHGSYDCLFATAEPERNSGQPRVFVIGGGGRGIPVYRQLQRAGIPFAAGVLPENDLDIPVAGALASVLVTDRAFEPVSAGRVEEALGILRTCETVLCPVDSFGTVNRENRRLLDEARKLGILHTAETLTALC